ncbi:MAG: S8 family serine peptidase [Oscillospiraceae bacterium]|nr:S8 family serine peptidase [Oscillospiraceae bacterium]
MPRILRRLLALTLALALVFGGLVLVQRQGLRLPPDGSVPGGAPDVAAVIRPDPEPLRFPPPDPDPDPVVSYLAGPEDFVTDAASGTTFVRGIVTVFFRRGTAAAQRQEAFDTVYGTPVGWAEAVGKYTLAVPGEGTLAELRAVCRTLEAFPFVAGATIDRVSQLDPQYTADDPYLADSLNRGLSVIEAPAAWDLLAQYGQESPSLGMLDTGVDATHEDLAGAVVCVETVHHSGKDYTFATSPQAHGTGVASVMAAVPNNSKGFVGVAWDGSLQAFDVYASVSGGRTQESVVYDGLLQLVLNGARAVNFSAGWELYSFQTVTQADIAEEARTAALHIASLLDAGYEPLVVQSAGNGYADTKVSFDAIMNGFFCCVTPANTGLSPAMAEMVCRRILVVGAAQQQGSIYIQRESSNAGSQVNLCAPGTSVRAAVPGDQYATANGTSLSAPMVTATAAMLFAVNPNLTGGSVRDMILHPANTPVTVYDNTSINHPLVSQYPMLNVRLALTAAVRTRSANTGELAAALGQAAQITLTGEMDPVARQAFSSAYSLAQALLAAQPSLLDQPAVDSAAQALLDAIAALGSIPILLLAAADGAPWQVSAALDIVSGVPPKTTAAALAAQLTVTGNGSFTYEKAAQAGAPVCTGDTILLKDSAGQLRRTYTVAVAGDVSGDGFVNGVDMLLFQFHQLRVRDLADQGPAWLAAADANLDDTLNGLDYRRMEACAVGWY